jgi:phage host-nuclease inhibitor protein Gam
MIAPNENVGGKAAKKISPLIALAKDSEFQNLVALLAVYSEADNRLKQLEAGVNERVLEIVDEERAEYATLQQKLVEAENALELIARKHPEWFATGKTLKTPYGAVALKNNPPKLNVANAEVSIVLIEAAIAQDKTGSSDKLIRTHKELNLEALAELTDEQLAKFRIKRTNSDTFTVKPATLDLGKAISAKKEEA